jgi:Fe-Mn family superoxide dismutase
MANKKDVTQEELVKVIRESLGLKPKTSLSAPESTELLEEAYVIAAKVYNLSTEMLSMKNKTAQQLVLQRYVDAVNETAAQLDAADREQANSDHSDYRSLKMDETYNLNGAFLSGLFLDNVSDLRSQISMDSLTFMRLERDFGTFDEWQKDFIAAAMSSRNGWACTVYNGFLNRYVNVVIDSNAGNVPLNCYPVVVLNMWENVYYRDYLNDKKTYIFAMMKELNWEIIEERVRKTERISKVLK